MELRITGVIKNVLPESRREHNDKVYISQSVLVEEDKNEYPSTFKIEFSDKVNAFQYVKGAKSGDRVDITCELKGRPYTNKQEQLDSFFSLNGFKYQKISESSNTQTSAPTQARIDNSQADDLPF